MDLSIYLLLIILPSVTTITCILFFTIAKTRPRKTLPPGPTALPVLGNTLQLYLNFTTLHKFLAKLSKTYGSLMSLKIGSITTIVVSSSTLAKEVLLKNNLKLTSRTVPDIVQFLKQDQIAPLVMHGTSPKWQVFKKIYRNQLFGDKMLEVTQILRRQKVNESLSHILKYAQEGIAIDVGEAIYNATFDIMSNTVFSLGMADDERIAKMLDLVHYYVALLGKPNAVDVYPFLRRFDPQLIRHRGTSTALKLFKLIDEIIDERLKRRLMDQVGSSGNLPRDLLDVLINIMETQNDCMDREKMLYFVFDIISLPMDAIAVTVQWAMAELLRNPKVLSKCQEEIDAVVGRGKEIRDEDISKLPYLQAIVKETLRLHPAIPIINLVAEEDVEIGGFTIPKGALLIVHVWAIGRDYKAWPDAHLFLPERFLGLEIDVKGQHFDLIPFGAGRRSCAGFPMVLRLVPMMLASLVGSFDWKLQRECDLEDLNMDDVFGYLARKAKPFHAIPVYRL